MKAVVIGSNSFLAGHIIRKLAATGTELLLFGQELQPEFSGCRFYPFNIPGNAPDLSQLDDAGLVVYCAGAGTQPGTKEPEGLIYELNAFLPVRLFNYLSQTGFKGAMVTFGSYFEIGSEPAERFYREDELATTGKKVFSHYAASKRMLTRYIHSAPGLPHHFHLVLPNYYGPGENPARLIPYILGALATGTPIRLTGGSQVRQYLHATDAAEMVARLPGLDIPPGIYNLCRREPVTVRELAMEILATAGRPEDADRISFGTEQRADTAMPYLLLENEKCRLVAGFEPTVTIEEGMRTCLQLTS